MADRPPHLPPGTPLSDHYSVEGLVRLWRGRVFDLAKDPRPARPTLRCWTGGHEHTPRGETACRNCGAPLGDRRFLISARWIPSRFAAYRAFFERQLHHPGLAPPIDVFVD